MQDHSSPSKLPWQAISQRSYLVSSQPIPVSEHAEVEIGRQAYSTDLAEAASRRKQGDIVNKVKYHLGLWYNTNNLAGSLLRRTKLSSHQTRGQKLPLTVRFKDFCYQFSKGRPTSWQRTRSESRTLISFNTGR